MSFCYSCGQPLTARDPSLRAPSPRSRGVPSQVIERHVERTRPAVVTLLAVLQLIGAAIALAIAALAFVLFLSSYGSSARQGTSIVATVFAIAATAQSLCGIGLLRMRNWARLLQMTLAWVALPAFPIGTIVGILILVYLFKPGVKLLFSDTDFDRLTPTEAAQVSAVLRTNAAASVIIAVAAGLGIVFVMGIVAAISIPALLRARLAANEAAAIRTVRRIGWAQEKFFKRCGRYATSLQMLGDEDGLPPELFADSIVVKDGYLFTIEPGANADFVVPASIECPGGVTEYFAKADPSAPGASGLRHFALDRRNIVVQANQEIPNPIPDNPSPVR